MTTQPVPYEEMKKEQLIRILKRRDEEITKLRRTIKQYRRLDLQTAKTL